MRHAGIFALFVLALGTACSAPTWEWDGVTWKAQTPAIHPSPRQGHSLVYDATRGVTVLFGGVDCASHSFADT